MAAVVKATQPGFFGCYREPGDVFEIPDDTTETIGGKQVKVSPFSPAWMEKVEDEKPAKPSK